MFDEWRWSREEQGLSIRTSGLGLNLARSRNAQRQILKAGRPYDDPRGLKASTLGAEQNEQGQGTLASRK